MCAAELTGDEWVLACSDDEITAGGRSDGGGAWAPDPAELEALYATIEKSGSLALDWRCPGRRAPSPVHSEEALPEMVGGRASQVVEEKSDFDFMDEMSSLRLRVRREGEDTLRGSAKKKTTSFDGILSNMYRHKRIEQMEKESSGASPPSAPSSSA